MELKKKFLRFRKSDEELLKQLHDIVSQNADKIVESFYDHLLKFEQTRALLSDEEVSRRLKGLQKNYLISLVSGEYGEDYFLSRKQIGKTHHRIKLAPQFYLGTYSLYFSLLYPLVLERFQDEPEKRQEAVLALVKIINMDSQIAMETYIDALHEQLEFANSQLQRLNWELEERVEERTEQLKSFEQKLRHVERLSLIGTVASEIAHEIGTPLNIISGRVELLAQKSKTDDRMQKDLDIINQQIERITRIIRELLNLSRPRDQIVVPVDLQDLLGALLEFLRISLEKAHIQTQLSVDPNARVLLAQKDHLQQVFLNLIVNAIQAMPDAGSLSIKTRRILEDGSHYICIEIQDTGKGIPEENLEKIFDPFFSTKSESEGTGLGLAIAREIVLKHGGYISVESELSRGSTFRVLLPATAEVVQQAAGS
jgi:signal transduction histidine kinase